LWNLAGSLLDLVDHFAQEGGGRSRRFAFETDSGNPQRDHVG
jgi:hypothetical protein